MLNVVILTTNNDVMKAIDYLFSFATDFLQILGEMSPYLLLGFFFAGLLYAFIPKKGIEKYLGSGKIKPSVLASLFGIPLPLCSCGVIPTGTALYKNGASKGSTVSFLISTPQTGVDSILATFSLMGLPFAIIRPVAALITGISGGVITSYITSDEAHLQIPTTKSNKKKSLWQKSIDVFKYGFIEFIQDISKWLVVGLILAAAISALIPHDFIQLLNLPPILQMLMILTVSIPFYICATGSIPLAAVLISLGISPGAAFVLLMAGPATNAATITMIGKVLGRKSLFTYLIIIIAGALGFGVLIDYALPLEWFSSIIVLQTHNHGNILNWWQLTSAIVLMTLIINGFVLKYIKNRKENKIINTDTMNIKILKVNGMTCNHCKTNIENNLSTLPSVNEAKVNLSDNTVTITGDNIDVKTARSTIESLGYEVVP